jgi:beta-lactamase class A
MKQKKILIIIILLLLLVSSATNLFASQNEREVLRLLFTGGPQEVEYTTQFQKAVPLSSMTQITDQIFAQIGALLTVEGEANPYTIVFEKGHATFYIALDPEGKIAGLQITEIIPEGTTLEDAVAQIIDMKGTTSVLVRKNGKTLYEHNPHLPLAVGSAFKLAILAALDDAIEQGRLDWEQIVVLDPKWKSLPTGILQDWPNGSRVTIETLATLMISMSDNTATDALIDLVGREEIGTYIPSTLVTLSTGELFRLKNPDNKHILETYRNASTIKRKNILDTIGKFDLPDSNIFSGNPIAIDIEWYMSTTQLANLIERLEHLDLLTVNPGLANVERWQRVAYKGGSEPGVLNLTTFLIDTEGNRYSVSVTVNDSDSPLPENDIISAYQTILHTL